MRNFEYKDQSAPGEGKYSYRVKFIGKDGGYAYSDIQEVEILPTVYALDQNYPNPFNPSTTISYKLPFESKVSVVIYNTLGQKVAELVNQVQPGGAYKYIWNAGNYASGVYILRLSAKGTAVDQNFSKTMKLMMLK